MQESSLCFETITPSADHLLLIHTWKHHPSVLKYSFSEKAKSFEAFQKEYKAKYHAIDGLPPQWIIYQGQKTGVLYFEQWFKKGCAVLSIFLDPKHQNQRIGTVALKKALLDLSGRGFEEIIAFVKPENIGAKKVFEKAGFSCTANIQVPKYGELFTADKYHYQTGAKKSPKTFIIAEIGSNFCLGDEERNLQLAKCMIEESYIAGADAAKFQLFNSKGIYVPNAGVAGYLNEDINEIFKKYALPPHFIPKLYDHANYLGIELMCSFFSKEDFEYVDPYVKKHKIASYEIRHIRLLELAAKSKKPLILSTGASNKEDIEWAIETFFANGGKDLTLMQCTAKYPAESESLNLACIPALKEHFNLPVGLSDHSSHPLYAPIAAVTLGASVIEKHVTLHQKLPGPDHFFSIDFKGLKDMCLAIRETENMVGLAKKEIFPQEEDLAAFARRGLQAILPIRAGDLLKEDHNIAILRPGEQRLGIHPKYLVELEGKKAAQDISLGCGIQLDDIIW